jgi:AraC-like DNA-binding protein
MSMIKKFIESSTQGIQALGESAVVLSDYITQIIQNTHGYRLATFIEMLQTMSKIKDWKYLSNQHIENPISDYEGLRMNDIYQYTMKNYNEDISLEEIAAVIHLTPQSFCRYFRKHTRKTYTNFLNEIRINEACKKFMFNDFTSISAIAYQTGFNNVSTFNRVFKSIIGKSPSEYIHQYRTKVSLSE